MFSHKQLVLVYTPRFYEGFLFYLFPTCYLLLTSNY
jgi:hypothetical protein